MDVDVQRFAEVEQRCRANTRRIDALERRQEVLQRLATAVEVLASEQKHLQENIDRMGGKLDALESKPAKYWEKAVEKGITVAVTAAVTFLLARLGVTG